MARQVRTRKGDNVRIGPITLVTLIAVLCMAVLAVLAVSTANATLTISERQAQATQGLYANETAAQHFVAGVDDVLATQRASGASRAKIIKAIDAALDDISQQAQDACDGQVQISAQVEKDTVTGEFTSQDMRKLVISLSIQDDDTYRVEQWKATAAQQEAAPMGNLWSGE